MGVDGVVEIGVGQASVGATRVVAGKFQVAVGAYDGTGECLVVKGIGKG